MYWLIELQNQNINENEITYLILNTFLLVVPFRILIFFLWNYILFLIFKPYNIFHHQESSIMNCNVKLFTLCNYYIEMSDIQGVPMKMRQYPTASVILLPHFFGHLARLLVVCKRDHQYKIFWTYLSHCHYLR